MKISAFNGIPTVRNYGYYKNNKAQGADKNVSEQRQERNLLDYPKNYRPSFGILETLGLALAYEVVVWGGLACYFAISNKKERKEEQRFIAEQRKQNVQEIENKFHISTKEAEKYHDNYLKIAQIEPNEDGDEIGLNSVMGYGVEKYKMAVDYITPLVANEKDLSMGGKVSNGVLLYGPAGSGKTYMAQKTCEHLNYFGIKVEDVNLTNNDHEKNAQMITEAFERGKERYEETGKYTVLNFPRDLDNFLPNRNARPAFTPEVAAFLSAAENCAEKGVSWVGTANNPRDIDPAVLRAGRTGMKIAIGNMKDFAIADTLKYFLIKNKEDKSAETLDYKKVTDAMEEDLLLFTPSELKLIVENAKSHKMHPELFITADDLVREMHEYKENEFPTLASDELKKFREDREYVVTFEPEPEPEPGSEPKPKTEPEPKPKTESTHLYDDSFDPWCTNFIG